MKRGPLLGNSYLTRSNRLTGKRCSLRGPCDSYVTTTIKEMLGEVFSVWCVPRCYKQDKSRCETVASGCEYGS
jgi:hypothetical protein